MAADEPIRVMVVDDQADMRFLVGVILGDHAEIRIVAESETAEAALEDFEAAAPDVVIVDARMPAVDGYELSRRLLALRPGLPIALLTSSVDQRVEEQAAAAGVARVVDKADFGALPDVVRTLAGRGLNP